MLDLLVKKRPSKVYSFDEIFLENKPSNYLMEHFFEHFGFRLEELSWRFELNEIAAQVRATMEPLMKQLSIVLHAYQCDILVLSGRPTSMDAITELFIKYCPLTPDRLIRLNQYMVGNWYPLADGQGHFYDQKSVVAVGAMVGYLASTSGFHGMDLDFSQVVKNMKSTAKYLGNYNSRRQQVEHSYLTPTASTITLDIPVFPAFIGCKQFDAPIYQARPLFAIYNHSGKTSLRLMFQRNYVQNREEVEISDIMDNQGNTLPLTAVELVQQSLVDDGKYWLDKGEFDLSLN